MIFRFITLFLFLFIESLCAYPKMYASVASNVYRDMSAIDTLSRVSVMKEKKHEMSTYVFRAKKEITLGYWLDKNKMDPSSKQKSRAYLKEIRYLSHQNKILTEFIINTTLDTIYADKPRSFYAIMKSKHRVFKQNKKLSRAISKYKQKLRKREARRAKVKKDKNREKERKQQKYYRSAKNLNGKWKENADTFAQFTFKSKNLQILLKDKHSTQKIIGTYTTNSDTLIFLINKVVRITSDGITHKRKTTIKRNYKIIKVNKKQLILELYKNEGYNLTKQK